jgi:hypothetical protein
VFDHAASSVSQADLDALYANEQLQHSPLPLAQPALWQVPRC